MSATRPENCAWFNNLSASPQPRIRAHHGGYSEQLPRGLLRVLRDDSTHIDAGRWGGVPRVFPWGRSDSGSAPECRLRFPFGFRASGVSPVKSRRSTPGAIPPVLVSQRNAIPYAIGRDDTPKGAEPCSV